MDDAQQAPVEPAPAAGPPRRRSFAGGCLRTAAGLLLLLVLVVVLAAIVWYRANVTPVKSSRPYQMALELVQKDPKVIGQLGEPIEQVFWPPPHGTNLEGGSGKATVTFEVAGPKGTADVEAEGRMIEGKWGLGRLRVAIAGTDRSIDIDTSEKSGLEAAPLWKPGG